MFSGFALIAVLALAAGCFIRAVTREFAVARLQSDFVAAFARVPDAADPLRQFTDMLRGTAAT